MGLFNFLNKDKNKLSEDHLSLNVEGAEEVSNLPKPKTQIQEALFLLLEAPPSGLTRKDFMDKAWIMNAPSCIHLLRKRGVEIITTEVKTTNKWNRDVSYSKYSLANHIVARIQYRKLNH